MMKPIQTLSAIALSTVFAVSAFAADHYQQIRNATGRLEIADKTFLIDPMLAKKDTYPGFEGSHNSHLRNPLVDLPMSAEDVYKGVDAIVVTHTHLDHWDPEAQKLLPKDMLIIAQDEADADIIRKQGFKNVKVLNEKLKVGDVTLIKTHGTHGTAEMYTTPLGERLGETMGVVFAAQGHKTVYLMGDTVWTADVNKALAKYNPEILIMNTGDARLLAFPDDGIIMSKKDVRYAHNMLPQATIIAVHMDAINHGTVTREDLHIYTKENKLDDRVRIPADGEVVKY